MKKVLFLFAATLVVNFSFSQSETYFTSGTETIFSFADVDYEVGGTNNIMRFAPVFNPQGQYHVDFNKNIGFFTGIGVKNVGYILDKYIDEEGDEVKKKFRTYNFGIPAGVKLGNLDNLFFYGGYEIEFPFHYKEKTFKDENKDKLSTWFSDRVEQFQHGFFVGIQFPYGANLKFKYYLSEFHNQSYTLSNDYQPYKGLKSNIFYISLNFSMFKDDKLYFDGKKEYY
jgi:hypothetical protein